MNPSFIELIFSSCFIMFLITFPSQKENFLSLHSRLDFGKVNFRQESLTLLVIVIFTVELWLFAQSLIFILGPYLIIYATLQPPLSIFPFLSLQCLSFKEPSFLIERNLEHISLICELTYLPH